MKRVLFVCLGNVSRSAAAEQLLKRHVAQADFADKPYISSAGVEVFSAGRKALPNSAKVAPEFSISLDDHLSRRILPTDFYYFDLMLAMDMSALRSLQNSLMVAPVARAQCDLFLNYAGKGEIDIPDPYGFPIETHRKVMATIEDAIPAIAERLLAGDGGMLKPRLTA